MDYIIVELDKTRDYSKHFEIMLKTKYGYQPVMTWHPSTGEHPKMFDNKDDAEKFVNDNRSNIKDKLKVDLGSYQIVFVPKDGKYVQHFELIEVGFFSIKVVQSSHPITGDRAMMFDSWKETKDKIFEIKPNESNSKKKLKF